MNRKIIKNFHNPKTMGVWIVFMLLFIMELLLNTWCRVQCVRYGYAISQATERQQNILLTQKNLQIEVAHLKTPQRIAKIATEQLGLTFPKPDQLVVIP